MMVLEIVCEEDHADATGTELALKAIAAVRLRGSEFLSATASVLR